MSYNVLSLLLFYLIKHQASTETTENILFQGETEYSNFTGQLLQPIHNDTGPLLKTTHGLIRGLRSKAPNGKDFEAFLGIPFAKPPLGKLRFRHPESAEPWSGIFNATELPETCEQRPLPWTRNFKALKPLYINTPLSEDCLKLNLWVPFPRPKNVPVMIWIYGGSYLSGSCSLHLYNGNILATEENVIVACMNYRLSTLGFLFLDHPAVPGNAGLYDQLLAVQWLKDNAYNFGGDPNKITVFGESAGASSAGHLLLSPLNRNLFDRAILVSGTITSAWAKSDRIALKNASMDIAYAAGCSNRNWTMDDVIQCLQETGSVTLIESSPIFEKYEEVLSPVADGKLILQTEDPYLYAKDRNYSILLGNTANEGSTTLLVYASSKVSLYQQEATFSREAFRLMLDKLTVDNKLLRKTAELLYSNWTDPSGDYYNSAETLSSDIMWFCDSKTMSKALSQSGHNVFNFLFNHYSDGRGWPKWMGVTHGTDIEFVFGAPLDPRTKFNSKDVEISKRMMRFWGNFARSGDPTTNEDGSRVDAVHWKKFNSQSQDYMHITSEGNVPGRAHRAQFCRFWNKFVPELLESKKKSICET